MTSPQRPSARALAAKLLRALVGLVLLGAGYVGFFSLAAPTSAYPVVTSASGPADAGSGAILGAVHVHTTASDGRGTVEEVAKAAREAGLRFVLLADHNQEELPAPRWVDGVLMVPGTELSTPWGHALSYGAQRGLTAAERSAEPIRALHALGGRAYLAHPVQRRNPWRDWDAGAEADGLELYSFDTLWREALAHPFGRLLPAVGAFSASACHGMSLLVVDAPEARQRLLARAATGPAVALCGLDAHGWPGYREAFSSLAMALPAEELPLPPDASQAAARVLEALSAGRGVCVFRCMGPPGPISLDGLRAGQRAVRRGERLRLEVPGLGAAAQLRVAGQGRLEPDGRTVVATEPGALQLEVWVRAPGKAFGQAWRPWLVLSPLRVEEEAR